TKPRRTSWTNSPKSQRHSKIPTCRGRGRSTSATTEAATYTCATDNRRSHSPTGKCTASRPSKRTQRTTSSNGQEPPKKYQEQSKTTSDTTSPLSKCSRRRRTTKGGGTTTA